MALINCKECGAEVSSTALSCPKCGKTIRKPKRSFFGQIVKWIFILFNLLMLYWLVAGIGGAADNISGSEAEQAGAAIGTGLGAIMIIFIWVAGAVILGLLTLFTRAKK